MTAVDDALFKRGVSIPMTKTYCCLAVAWSLLLPSTALVVGAVTKDPRIIAGGVFSFLFISIAAMILFISLPHVLFLSRKGLYVRQLRMRLNWIDIKRVYLIDMRERLKAHEKKEASFLGVGSLKHPTLMAIEFTPQGLKRHGRLTNLYWQDRYPQSVEHVLIRTNLFASRTPHAQSTPELVALCEEFRKKATVVTESVD